MPHRHIPPSCLTGLLSGQHQQLPGFCRDPAFLEQQLPGKALEQVWDSLQQRPRDWQDCVRWARRHWQSCYHDAITQLLHTYPPEHVSPPLHLPSTGHLTAAKGTHSWA